jgi:hypothetical protein
LAAFLWRKQKKKFLLASFRSLIHSENHSSNLLLEACSGCQEAAFDSKSYDMNTGENSPMAAKESQNINSDVAFGTIFTISTVKVFKEATEN